MLTNGIIDRQYKQIYTSGRNRKRTAEFHFSPLLIVFTTGASGSVGGERVKTVLVLEDDVSILALIRLIVEQDGYEVLEATSAEQAFQRFEEHDAHVDLLITDVTLPVTSGIRVALELRSLVPYLKIIITSGFPPAMWNDEDAAELDELPSDSVITLQKPFNAATLIDSIHRFIGLPFVATPSLQVKTASS